MKEYEVRTGCEIAGRWRSAGETILLSTDEARELVPPFGNVVFPAIKKGAENAKLNRRKRSDRRGAD